MSDPAASSPGPPEPRGSHGRSVTHPVSVAHQISVAHPVPVAHPIGECASPVASAPRGEPWCFERVQGMTHDAHGEIHHTLERATLTLAHGRLHRGAGYATASRAARHTLARTGAILRLRRRGRYHLHAAGVVDPHGRAWLLTGESGSGKSTLAYALVRAGWQLLGDDAVILERAGDRILAHPWRDPLLVSARLAPHYPELAPERHRAAGHDPRLRIPLHRPIARTAPVRAVLLLERAERRTIALAPPLAALAALIRQSRWVLLDDRDAAGHLALLRALVAATPVYHLAHTPAELHDVPALLAALSSPPPCPTPVIA